MYYVFSKIWTFFKKYVIKLYILRVWIWTVYIIRVLIIKPLMDVVTFIPDSLNFLLKVRLGTKGLVLLYFFFVVVGVDNWKILTKKIRCFFFKNFQKKLYCVRAGFWIRRKYVLFWIKINRILRPDSIHFFYLSTK